MGCAGLWLAMPVVADSVLVRCGQFELVGVVEYSDHGQDCFVVVGECVEAVRKLNNQ